MNEYGILLFPSITVTMQVEKYLLEKKFTIRIIAIPEVIEATCGFALRYELSEEKKLVDTLNDAGFVFERRIHAQGKGLKITYQEVD